jgi:hypothetical protein
MKKVSILIFMVLIYLNVFSQNSIKIGKKTYYFEEVDSTRNRINGWWKVVGGEFFYDDDGTPSKEKWYGRDFGKRMFISDSLFTFYTPSFFEFYEKPKFVYEYFDLKADNQTTSRITLNTNSKEFGPTIEVKSSDIEGFGSFFKKFPAKVLGVNLYRFQDPDLWRGKDYEFSYCWFYLLNPNLIAFFNGNQVYYLERIIESKNQIGWDEENGFKIIKYNGFTGAFDLKLDNLSINSFLEVHYWPQKNCNRKSFQISTYHDRFTLGDRETNLYSNNKPENGFNIIRIPTENLKTNYLEISLGNCDIDEEWILKWRIIKKEVFKKIKYEKVKLNLSQSQPTKMYLVKGDEVEIVEEKGDWVKIRYYGKKVIEGWIKKSDVE